MSIYIYGIIETNQAEHFGPIGIGGRGDAVTTLHFKDIAAVVSNHPVVEFDRFAENELKELVAAHQLVNETVMKSFGVAPLSFGNIAESEEEVIRMLQHAYIQCKTMLNKVKEKVELVVQAFRNKQDWIQEIANTNEQIIKLKNALDSGSEADNLMARIEIGKGIHQAISSKERAFCDDVLSILRNGSCHFAAGKLHGEDMIFNGSFLVDPQSESAFDQKVDRLGHRYEGQLTFRYIGPLPPYSFANLKLTSSDFELIDAARRILVLPDKATVSEIKSAYRTLACQYHPDKSHDNPEAEEKFRLVTEAHQVLETFCQNYKFSFSEEVVRDTVLIDEA